MAELVSSMVVDLKLRVEQFNQKINSAKVEMQRMTEQVNDLADKFSLAGAVGLGFIGAIIGSSPVLAGFLARLKVLWLDISMTLGEVLRPILDSLLEKFKGLWDFLKSNPFLLKLFTYGMVAAGALVLVGKVLAFLSIPAVLVAGSVLYLVWAFKELKRQGEFLFNELSKLSDFLDDSGWSGNTFMDMLLLSLKTINNLVSSLNNLGSGDYFGFLDELRQIMNDLSSFAKEHPLIAQVMFGQVAGQQLANNQEFKPVNRQERSISVINNFNGVSRDDAGLIEEKLDNVLRRFVA